MTSHPDPIPTNEQLQGEVADLSGQFKQFKDLVNTQIDAMAREIHRLRQRERSHYSQT